MAMVAPGTPTMLAHRARSGLLSTLGAEAMVVGRAPGRVNLIGEHTDYNGGLVLPIALPHATYAAACRRSDGIVRIASRDEDDVYVGDLSGLASAKGWASYAAGVLWALQDAGVQVPGMDLYIDSTVPIGAGLSSSAAIECSVAVAALGLAGAHLSRQHIVDACVRAETEVAGAPTGGMDQTVAIFAEEGAALLIDFGSHTSTPVPIQLGDRVILVTDTGVRHQLTDGDYGSRREECARAAAALGVSSLRDADRAQVERIPDEMLRRRARHIVTEIDRVPAVFLALRSRDWAALGELFAASHASMRDDFEISTRELDLAVGTARTAGADASRMTGGGFGGSIVSILPGTAVEEVTGEIDAAFARAGLGEPRHLLAPPGGPAGLS